MSIHPTPAMTHEQRANVRELFLVGWSPAGKSAWKLYEIARDAWKRVGMARGSDEFEDALADAMTAEGAVRDQLRAMDGPVIEEPDPPLDAEIGPGS